MAYYANRKHKRTRHPQMCLHNVNLWNKTIPKRFSKFLQPLIRSTSNFQQPKTIDTAFKHNQKYDWWKLRIPKTKKSVDRRIHCRRQTELLNSDKPIKKEQKKKQTTPGRNSQVQISGRNRNRSEILTQYRILLQ